MGGGVGGSSRGGEEQHERSRERKKHQRLVARSGGPGEGRWWVWCGSRIGLRRRRAVIPTHLWCGPWGVSKMSVLAGARAGQRREQMALCAEGGAALILAAMVRAPRTDLFTGIRLCEAWAGGGKVERPTATGSRSHHAKAGPLNGAA